MIYVTWCVRFYLKLVAKGVRVVMRKYLVCIFLFDIFFNDSRDVCL